MIAMTEAQPITSAMTISEEGIAAIKQREYFKDTAYQDEAGNWTVGHGVRFLVNPKGKLVPVTKGMQITPEESDRQVRLRIKKEFVPPVVQYVKYPVNQKQFDKLVYTEMAEVRFLPGP